MSKESEANESVKSKPSRLGRGLMDLIGEQALPPEATPPAKETESPLPSSELSIDLISPNPKQPRRTFVESDLEELAASIRVKGVLQAILVRPDPEDKTRFQIVAGERRWRAAKRAGLTSVPAVVKPLDELEVLEIGIIENVQRADLNPIEEAEAYQSLMKRFGRTQDNLAEQVGKSRPHITNTLRLLNLPERARELMREGKLSAGHARAALAAPEPEILVDQIVAKGLSVRDAEKLAQTLKRASEGGIETASAPLGPDKDVDTEALEADLEYALGLKVEIKHKPNGGGELRIRYRKLEQLDDVCRRLTAGKSSSSD